MPIKWSAVKVSEAMNEVETQVSLADAFIAEAKAKAEAGRIFCQISLIGLTFAALHLRM